MQRLDVGMQILDFGLFDGLLIAMTGEQRVHFLLVIQIFGQRLGHFFGQGGHQDPLTALFADE